jgi:uncharacterized protein
MLHRLPKPLRLPVRVLGLIAFGYALLLATLFFAQDRLIFPRHLVADAVINAVPPGAEELWITAPTGERVPAWLFLPASSPEGSRSPAAVFFHGNGELIDIIYSDPAITLFSRLGFALLFVEYRGYGRAQGAPSQAALTDDGLAFVRLLEQRPDIDPDRIIYIGRSIGGGVASAVADRRPPAALVLISSFTSVASFAGRFLAPEWLVRHPFRTDRVLPTLNRPVLLFHGEHDPVVKAHHSQTLAAITPGAQLLIQPASHNDFPSDFPAYEQAVTKFLAANNLLPTR